MADIAVSFAEVLPAQHPAVFGLPIEHVTALLGKPQNSMPVDLDLADPATHAALCSIDLDWPQIAAEQREEWLQNVRVSLPIRQIATGDIALLPGGIITARHPTTCLVCDPQQAVTLDDDAARQVRRVLAGRAGVATLINTEDGVTLRSVLPDLLPPQCASIVGDASNLPGSAAFAGPVVIQWFATGATMWPMLPAPPALALAASIAAAPLSEDASPTAAEFWDASDAETRQNLLATSLENYLCELLPAELSDDLRFGLMDHCVAGNECLASELAEMLAAVPACFRADPKLCPGEPASSWSNGVALLRRARRPLAMLGIERCTDPRRAVEALREAIADESAVIFHETSEAPRGVSALLNSDAALFVARWAGRGGRLGVILETHQTPSSLYALASELARSAGATVVAAAPCWGFCHRIAHNGSESGNAGWFGMGVGLDELDLLAAGVSGIC